MNQLADIKTPATASEETDITGQLARYMASVAERTLPEAVMQASKHRILDTVAAIVSGAKMVPGEMAINYVGGLGGTPQASIMTSDIITTAANAAMANAMCAHADETDDFDPETKAHPGSSAVPAALAMGEKNGSSGLAVIRSVALGYDLGCRLLLALGAGHVRATHRSAEGTSSTFCALGATAPLAGFDEQKMRYAISYAAQQVSGIWSWVKDKDHVEKAFDFAGMGARNGVTAVTMVEAGLTGVHDVLDGTHNLFIALSTRPDPQAMVAGLGERYFVTESAIKTFSVGYPNQSVLDAALRLRREHDITPEKIQSIHVRIPTDAVGIVGNSQMPDVSCQYLVSVALLKGEVSFEDSHDPVLMQAPEIQAIRKKITLSGDETLMDPLAPRGAIVRIVLTDGRQVEHYTRFAPGTKERPLTTEQVNRKAYDLMAPVLGDKKTTELIEKLNNLEQIADIRELRPLWTA